MERIRYIILTALLTTIAMINIACSSKPSMIDALQTQISVYKPYKAEDVKDILINYNELYKSYLINLSLLDAIYKKDNTSKNGITKE